MVVLEISLRLITVFFLVKLDLFFSEKRNKTKQTTTTTTKKNFNPSVDP